MSTTRVPVSTRRRVAAVAALVGLVALVAFVVAVLVGHGAHVVTGLVGIAIAVAGAWWAITARMPRRAIGAVGVAVGLVIVGVALVNALDGAERIAAAHRASSWSCSS